MGFILYMIVRILDPLLSISSRQPLSEHVLLLPEVKF